MADNMKNSFTPIQIHDVTLRDGNHALKHQLSIHQASAYAAAARASGIKSIEVGHGNGLGGSSILVGDSLFSDLELIEAVKTAAPNVDVVVHVMPSFATIKNHIAPAIAAGVTKFRVAAHCTEVDTTERQISYVLESGKKASLAIMMITHISESELLAQIETAVKYGISEIVLMDSVGRLVPADVGSIVTSIGQNFDLRIAFHGHDNLGLAIANSLTAAISGCQTIDASILGMGAGAGNTAMELLAPALDLTRFNSEIDLGSVLRLARFSRESLNFIQPRRGELEVATALSNLFSGYSPVIQDAAERYNVDPLDVAHACLGKKLVAGQEDLVLRVAEEIST